MSIDLFELGSRALNCSGWRVLKGCPFVHPVEGWEMIADCDEADSGGAVPDFRNSSAVGCLLHLAREVSDNEFLTAERELRPFGVNSIPEGWSQTVHRNDTTVVCVRWRVTVGAENLYCKCEVGALVMVLEKFDTRRDDFIGDAVGDCFEASALQFLGMRGHIPPGMVLAHGTPKLTRSPFTRFKHSWIEYTFQGEHVCWDVSDGKDIKISRDKYYRTGNIDPLNVRKYSAAKASRLIFEHGHYGPWETDDRGVDLDEMSDAADRLLSIVDD